MVLIGFTIFSILIASAYTSFDNKQETIDMFELSEKILRKVSSPNAVFTFDGNKINLPSFTSDQATNYIKDLQDSFSPHGFIFVLKLSCEDTIVWLPDPPPEPSSNENRYASSKHISVKTNEVSILPGKITIVFWQQLT
jgi:hypothetical protein